MVCLCKPRRTGHTLRGLSRSFSQLRRKAFPFLPCFLPLDGLKALQNTFHQKKKCLCRRQGLKRSILIIRLQMNSELKFNSSCLSPV